MSDRISINGYIHMVSTCITCGVAYTVPELMWNQQQMKGGYHYCPNGHSQGWSKDQCETARLRQERDRLAQRVAQRDDEIRAAQEARWQAERSASAYKGQATKLRKRAKAGVCPCCNRTFQNLARHMQTQHPKFGPDEPALKVVEGGKA